MGSLNLETIEAATGGLITDSPPSGLPIGTAPVHQNFLVDRDGALVMRGPIPNHSELSVGTDELIAAVWKFNDKLLVSRVNKSATTVREPWTQYHRPVTAASTLAVPVAGANDLKLVDLGATTVTNVTANTEAQPGGRGVRLGEYVYGYNYSGGGVDRSTYFIHDRTLLRWDGTTTAPSTVSNAPRHAIDVAVHLNRLWTLGGDDSQIGGTNGSVRLAYDNFANASASGSALSATTAPRGGAWAEAGDIDDWTLYGGDYVYRAPAAADAAVGSGQYGILGTTSIDDVLITGVLSVFGSNSLATGNTRFGVFLRYVDTNNWVGLMVEPTYIAAGVYHWGSAIYKKVAGVLTLLDSDAIPGGQLSNPGEYRDLDVAIRATREGDVTASLTDGSETVTLQVAADANIATGGALATGKFGIYHGTTIAGAPTGTTHGAKCQLFEATAIGGTASNLNFTDENGPLNDLASDWQDDATGLVNKIVVDSNDSDSGVALAKCRDNLVIFKRNSIHVLYGYSPSTFNLRPLTRSMGCLDQRSIVETVDGVYWLSQQGYMYYDGSNITNMSALLSNSLLVEGDLAVGDNGVDGGRAVAASLSNNYILLSISRQTFSSGAQPNRFCALLHTPTGRWSRFVSDSTSLPAPVEVGKTLNYSWICDGSRFIKVNQITRPEAANANQRGIDVVTITGTPTTTRINSVWHSRVLPLASPGLSAQLHRILVDHAFTVVSGDNNTTVGWYVSVYDAEGNNIVPEYQVDALVDPSSNIWRKRHVKDAYPELTDFQIRVRFYAGGGSALPVSKAELYECHVEYQPARQRRAN